MSPNPTHSYPTSFTLARLKQCVFTALVAFCVSGQVYAQDNDWWFDIEVVIFKRNIDVHTIAEQFDHTAPKFAANNALDLLSDYVQPNLDYLNAGLTVCVTPEDHSQSSELSNELLLENSVFQKSKQLAPDATFTKSPASGLSRPGTYSAADEEEDARNELPPSSLAPFSVRRVDWQLPIHLPCIFAQERVLLRGPYDTPVASPMPKRVPVEIDGVLWPERLSPYLLPKDNAKLDALLARIAGQRDLSPILHLTWRQPVVFGRSKAVPMKLIAGPNYASEFAQSGWRKSPKPSNNSGLLSLTSGQEPHSASAVAPKDLFKEIELALQDTTPLKLDALNIPMTQLADEKGASSPQAFAPVVEKPLWQLEGDMKIYLQNVGRTPYLHIDSDLDFRIPIRLKQQTSTSETQSDFLQSYNFNQLRRVISKQLHYFDHPLFGMVVQINRYEPPKTITNSN